MMSAGLIAAGVFGLAIGSFLNVVIARVPAGDSVIRPPSRCPRCGATIRPYDNIPVISWLVLRGRCRGCRAAISVRYPLVEALTSALFVVVALRLGLSATLPAMWYLVAVGVALSAIDLDVRRLPTAIIAPSVVVTVGLLTVAAVITGHWWPLVRAVIAAAILFACYYTLATLRPGAMGFGDVRLAGLLGLYLGWFGWGTTVLGTFLPFLLGGVVGLVIIVSRRGGRRARIPFGPFMVTGCLLALLWGQPIIHWYLGTTGLAAD
jgi:leader peptidase (prepilin peptidase) / N-methyltransferase